MIKHLIFDVGQVLVEVKFQEFLAEFSDMFKVDPFLLVKDRSEGAHIEFMVGKISGEEFHQKTCEFFNHFVELEKFKSLWLKLLGGQKNDTALIVDELSTNGKQLSILSNIDTWHFDFCLENIPVLNKFDKKFTSFQLGIKKPDPAIFEVVAEKLNAETAECLLIDDKVENVKSAREIGYQAIQFQTAEQLRKHLNDFDLLTS